MEIGRDMEEGREEGGIPSLGRFGAFCLLNLPELMDSKLSQISEPEPLIPILKISTNSIPYTSLSLLGAISNWSG